MEHETAQGIEIPKLGYGTYRLTGRDCRDGVAHALAVGYRHVDTAQGYDNEELVGDAIDASGVEREDLFLTTKLRPSNLAARQVRTSTEESLARLQVDHLDLLLIHWPNPEVPLAETLEAMMGLQQDGMVRGLGVSNFPPSLVLQTLAHTAIVTNQVEYHAYLSQDALLALAREYDHALTAYSPLARGEFLDEPVFAELAEEHDATPAQVAIAWLLAQDKVVTIPKATAPERIEENLAATEVRLTEEEVARVATLDRGSAGRIVEPPGAPAWERDD